MSYDWNWFFSSFCQSAAALIGIIGAFIISRLLGLTEKINSAISNFDNLVISYNGVVASLSNRKFSWYTRVNLEDDDDLIKSIKNGDYANLKTEEVLEKIYNDFPHIYKVDETVLDVFKKLFEKHRPRQSNRSNLGYLEIPTNIGAGFWDRVREEKESINKLSIESKILIQKFTQNLQELEAFKETTKPLTLIIILLMILFPLTVIYPLHFMPVIVNQNPGITFNPITFLQGFSGLKFFTLSFFFISIEGLFYYFLIMIKQLELKLNNAIENNSNNYRNIKNYSKYLE